MRSLFPRGYPQDIWALFATSIISSVGFSVTMPYMSLYLNNVLHVPMTMVGIILMIALVIGSTIGLYGGELSDRLGRKYMMVRSLFARFFIFILIGIVISRWSNIFTIFFLLLSNSILFSFYAPASMAYVADLTTEDKRISAYGLLRMGGNFGWALGPALGGLLATINYAYLFFFTGFCMLVAVFILLKFSRESLFTQHRPAALPGEKNGGSIKDILSAVKDRHFLIFTLISFALFMVWGQLVSPISVYSVNRIGLTKTQVGFLFSVNGFMVALFQYFITYLIPARKELTALGVGSLIYAVGYFSIGFAGGFAFMVAAIAVITIAEMVITPSGQTYAASIADPKHRGRYLGFYNLSQTYGWAFGPLLGGILLDTFPGRNIFIWSIISAVAVIAAVGFFFFKPKHNRPR